MAQIDIKEATVKIFDGTLGTATMDSTNADADLTLTAKSKHIGSDKISIELIDPATASALLGVVVATNSRKITVNLATSTASAISSTAALIKTAIEALPAANALVTVTLETAGAGVVEAIVETSLDGQLVYEVKIGEGTFSYTEQKPREFTLNRGLIDTVRNADDEPMDISMDATWEWIGSVAASSTLTLEDVVKKRKEAAAWLSTALDTCQPYCVDIEIWNAPNCAGTEDELLMFEEFYYESIDHDLRDGTLAFSGRCNKTEATSRRTLNAEVG